MKKLRINLIIKFVVTVIVMINLSILTGCRSYPEENSWSKDKNGCLQLRSRALADSLIEKYDLKTSSKETFLKVFHTPDTTQQTDNEEVLIYYMQSDCVNGRPVKESDHCWAEFYFKHNKLNGRNFPCE